jgi:hypothetical protein
MLMTLWLNVIAAMLFPGGQQMMALQAHAFEMHLRSQLEAPAPTSALFGAASHVARYQMPKLAA